MCDFYFLSFDNNFLVVTFYFVHLCFFSFIYFINLVRACQFCCCSFQSANLIFFPLNSAVAFISKSLISALLSLIASFFPFTFWSFLVFSIGQVFLNFLFYVFCKEYLLLWILDSDVFLLLWFSRNSETYFIISPLSQELFNSQWLLSEMTPGRKKTSAWVLWLPLLTALSWFPNCRRAFKTVLFIFMLLYYGQKSCSYYFILGSYWRCFCMF